jgi:16S rRNA (cytosine967-C5)-methyltransferase
VCHKEAAVPSGSKTLKSQTESARNTAVRFLQKVFEQDYRLDQLSQDGDFLQLDPRDRRLATELIYGVLRNRSLLDYHVSRFARTKLEKMDSVVLWILRLALYQVEFLRVPERAAVNEAVEQCRSLRKSSAAGFVNGLLRNFLRSETVLPEGDGPDALSIRYSHPRWLVDRYLQRWGTEITIRMLQRNNADPPLWVWVNRFRTKLEEFSRRLDEESIAWDQHPKLPDCLAIDSRAFTQHELYRQGYCFAMDPASQEVAHLLDLKAKGAVGDLCAAPGGKSFLMAWRKDFGTSLFACDVSFRRLSETLQRARLYAVAGVHFVCADLLIQAPFKKPLDGILLDVPCTGLGTLRANPDIRWKIQPAHLPRYQDRQKRLLGNALRTLARGGELIYSTCSTEPEENEDVVSEFADRRAVRIDAPYFKSFPQEHLGECFFAAQIRHA